MHAARRSSMTWRPSSTTGVTVNGWGLHLTSQKTGGSVSVVNNGAVVLDDTAARQKSALTIVGHGGLASYSGSGDVRNEVDHSSFSNDGLRISNAGDISVEISGGVINGRTGAFLFARGGAITLDMTGGEIGTSAIRRPVWRGGDLRQRGPRRHHSDHEGDLGPRRHRRSVDRGYRQHHHHSQRRDFGGYGKRNHHRLRRARANSRMRRARQATSPSRPRQRSTRP